MLITSDCKKLQGLVKQSLTRALTYSFGSISPVGNGLSVIVAVANLK